MKREASSSTPSASAIYRAIFAHEAAHAAEALLTHIDPASTAPTIFSESTDSISTACTVIASLAQTLPELKGQLRIIMRGRQWPARLPQRYLGQEAPSSHWAAGLRVYAEVSLGEYRRQSLHDLIAIQDEGGGWRFNDSMPATRMIYSFYPCLALRSASIKYPRSRRIARALSKAKHYLAHCPCATVEEAVLRDFLGRRLLGDPPSAGAGQLLLDESGTVAPAPTIEYSNPLFFVRIFRPALFRCLNPAHPQYDAIAIRLMAELRRSALPLGFAAGPGDDRPSGWATALGLAAGVRFCRHLATATRPRRERIVSRIGQQAREGEMPVYDFALSFSGVDRPMAKKTAERLKKLGYKVFYDLDYVHKLMGEELVAELTRVYLEQSNYVIVLVSENYKKSRWSFNVEWSAILARILKQKRARIIPYRLDDARLDGLKPSIGYIDAKRYGVTKFCDLLDRKFRGL